MKKKIPSQLAAGVFSVEIPDDRFVSISQIGLSGAEVIHAEINLGGTWTATVPAIELSTTTNYVQIAGPAIYRIVKPVTASPTSVYLGQ